MKYNKIVTKLLAGICSISMLAASASAMPTFTFETTDFPHGGLDAGELVSINSEFTVGGSFVWDFTIEENADGQKADAFYLVVDNGPEPSGNVGELAIIYGDLTNNTVSVYDYDGARFFGASFLNEGSFIESFDNAVTVEDTADTRRVRVSFDTANINSQFSGSGQGIAFDEHIGFWFHPIVDSSISYDENGLLTEFNGTLGFYDYNDLDTVISDEGAVLSDSEEVPEPATLALLLIGITGLVLGRNKKVSE